MTLIVGPSGIEMDVEGSIAAGLVAGGHAFYVKGEKEPAQPSPAPVVSSSTPVPEQPTPPVPTAPPAGPAQPAGTDATPVDVPSDPPVETPPAAEPSDPPVETPPAAEPSDPPAAPTQTDRPKGNASQEAWIAYATDPNGGGKTEQDVKGLSRDEIRALFKE